MKIFILFFVVMGVLVAAGCVIKTNKLGVGEQGPENMRVISIKEAELDSELEPETAPIPEISKDRVKQWSSLPKIQIDINKSYFAEMETSVGKMKIELFAKETPVAVNNFVFLARQGFYDNLKFHRIMKGFMIQGGCPRGDGTGGPGYKFVDEKITRDYNRGIVAMANSGPNTNGSQFFIMHADCPLAKNYVIFGQIVEGLDTLDKIAATPVKANYSGENSVPTRDVLINKIKIEEK